MLRVVLLILAPIFAACSHARPDALAMFAANERSLGFGGLWIGMSHADAERALMRKLPIGNDLFSDACGQGRSDVTLFGTTVSVQWADEEPREIEALYIGLSRSDVTSARTALSKSLGSWVDSCDTDPLSHLAACFRHAAGILLLAETTPQGPGVRLIMEDCTD